MKIAIVNDSRVAAEVLRRILAGQPDFQMIWTAYSGEEAVQLAQTERPDIVMMDLIMPGIDGAETTRQIMTTAPCAILVVTATTVGNRSLVFEAMGHGALDAVNTPSLGLGGDIRGAEPLLHKLRTVARLVSPRPAKNERSASTSRGIRRPAQDTSRLPIVAIGASTGGPQALAKVLANLPAGFPAAVLIARRGRRRSWLIYAPAIMDIRKILRYRVYLALVLLYAIAVVALCSFAPAVQQPVQLRLDEVSQEPAPPSSQDTPSSAHSVPQTLPANFSGFDENKQQHTIEKPIDQIQPQSTNSRGPLWALGAGLSLNAPLFAAEQAELIGLVLLAALGYRFRLRLMIWGAAIATFVGSRRRGTCVWLAFLIVLLLTTFPPWVQVITFPGRLPARHIKLWHAPIFREPYPTTKWDSIQLDYARMLMEIAVGESFVLALYWTWARSESNINLRG
jgi:CheY-like chemotaxis protein